MRTSASLIPTSSFQMARTNFMAWQPPELARHALADACAARQTFSTGGVAVRRGSRGFPGNSFETGAAGGRWAQERRATLRLAWPLILANVTLQAIQVTDVLLMGRLGGPQLAAATLALNLNWVFSIFLLGIITASSPMMATALGRRSNAVRDVRRIFRAGLWLIVIVMPPYWLLMWNVGDLMRAFGELEALASQGQTFLRAYMWLVAPWLLFQLLRNFVAAIERPRIILWLSIAGIALNALISWSLMFGHFGLPAFGLVGSGMGSTITWLIICGALIAVVSIDRKFRRFHLFGNWWRFDRQRLITLIKLGWPIGATMGLEIGVFALAALLMGWMGAAAVAAHAIALQLAAVTFMVPLGLGQAATVRVGLALGRGDTGGITRAGWTAWVARNGLHGRDGDWNVDRPAPARHLVPRRRAGQRPDDRPSRQLPQDRRRISARRRCAGDRRWNAARPSRHPLAADLRDRRLLGGRARRRRVAGVRQRLARSSASGPASPAVSPPSPH